MKILGYTDDKELVGVELPVDRIVAEGIDPWRLDLFDLKPISILIDGRLIHFRKLEDVAFFDEKSRRGWMTTGIFDSQGKTVFLQDAGNVPFSPKGKTEVSGKGFDEHFRDYLSALEKSFHTSGLFEIPATRLKMDWKHGVDGFETFRLADFCPLYAGETLSEIDVPYKLPDQLNFIFRRFGKWNPIIKEACLLNAMLNRPLGRVEFHIDESGAAELARAPDLKVTSEFGWTKVTAGDFVYTVEVKDVTDGGLDYWKREWRFGRQSVHCLYSTRENQVTGLRIAFHDITHLQSRRLFTATNSISPRSHVKREEKKEQDKNLVADGFKLIDGTSLLYITD